MTRKYGAPRHRRARCDSESGRRFRCHGPGPILDCSESGLVVPLLAGRCSYSRAGDRRRRDCGEQPRRQLGARGSSCAARTRSTRSPACRGRGSGCGNLKESGAVRSPERRPPGLGSRPRGGPGLCAGARPMTLYIATLLI